MGQLAAGIYGRSGDAIDAIGLVCAPAPAPPRPKLTVPGVISEKSHASDIAGPPRKIDPNERSGKFTQPLVPLH